MLIALTNSKGGVGKSTLAAHLACWLREQGQAVTLLDCDMQRSSSRWIKVADPSVHVVETSDPDEVLDTASELAEEADVVVADGPAGMAELTRSLLMVCDVAVIPCGPSGLDIEASSLAVRVVNQARKVRKDNRPAALFVANKVQVHTRLSKELLDAAATIGIPLAQTPIRFRQVYADAPGQRTTVFKMGYRAQEAAEELRTLFAEVRDYGRKKATR